MQQQQVSPKAQTPGVWVFDPSAVPKTADEVQALRIKLNDLRDELQDAATRRRNISEQLRTVDNRASKGIEDRLEVLDARIVQIERDITTAGMMLKAAPSGAVIAGTTRPPDPNAIAERITEEIVPIVAILSIFVFAPMALAMSLFIWRRATARPAKAAAVTDQAAHQRLEQLQQSVDTIAIEIERISEGQRFVTRLLSERDQPALGVGAAESLRAKKSAGAPIDRG